MERVHIQFAVDNHTYYQLMFDGDIPNFHDYTDLEAAG
jgi:hypothetical protein